MNIECGICEYKGDLAGAPSFICFNCTDAIRRLVWLCDREQQATQAPLAMTQPAAITGDKAAAPGRR